MEENNGKVVSIFPRVAAGEENNLSQLEVFIKSRWNPGMDYRFVFEKDRAEGVEYKISERAIFDISEYYGIKGRIITNFYVQSYEKALISGGILLKTENITNSITGEKLITKIYKTNENTLGTFIFDEKGEVLEFKEANISTYK
jgi:hypothetical protein